MKYFTKARQYWQEGELVKAIHEYQRVVRQSMPTEQQHDIAVYMIAYLTILLAKQTHTEMGVLGVDLSQPYQDYYYKAELCMTKIYNANFNPEELGLPVINQHDKKEMAEAYQQRSYINRCIREFLPQAWKLNHKTYLQSFFARLRVMSHFFTCVDCGNRCTRL